MDFRELIDVVAQRLGIYEKEYLIEGMAKVGPKTTGENIWIQIRQKPDGKHKEPTIKVRLKDAIFKQDKENTAVVSINNPRVVKGMKLSKFDMKKVERILDRARPQLLAYWEGEIQDTEDAIDAMRKQ